jgi:hypothetical protein
MGKVQEKVNRVGAEDTELKNNNKIESRRAHSPLLAVGLASIKIRKYQIGIEDSSQLAARIFNCSKKSLKNYLESRKTRLKGI